MIYLPFKNLKNFTERGQKKFKKIIAHNSCIYARFNGVYTLLKIK